MTDEPCISRRTALRYLSATVGGLTGIPALPESRTQADRGDDSPLQPSGSTLHARAIPSSGQTIPVIGLGTWQTFDVGNASGERTPLVEVVKEFARLGGRLIDSSPMYRNAEEVTGDIVAQLGLRNALFMATKVWTTGRQDGIEQMRASMEKLRAKPIDLMQVHNLLDVGTHLPTLREWKQEGLIRYLGVTHYTASAYNAVEKILAAETVDFLQINYSIAEREAERRLLPLAREKGIAVIANRPFAGGGVFSRIRERQVPEWASEIDCSSWAQLLLKFIVSHPGVTCAIPATSNLSHLRDNMQAGRGRMPDAAMRERIAKAALG